MVVLAVGQCSDRTARRGYVTCFKRSPHCSRHFIMLRLSTRLIITWPATHQPAVMWHTHSPALEIFAERCSILSHQENWPACEEHAPANDGDREVAGLGDELEGPVQMEQRVDILRHLHGYPRHAVAIISSRSKWADQKLTQVHETRGASRLWRSQT